MSGPLASPLLSIAAVVGLAGALVFGYRAWSGHQQRIGEERVTQRYEAAIAQQKSKAAHALAREIRNTIDLERQLAAARENQEENDATNKRTMADLRDRLRAASADTGRLRDPNAVAARCGGSGDRTEGTATAGADGGAGDAAEAGGLLSAQLSGLLQRLAAEADEVNIAYIACRADAVNVRATIWQGE